MTTTGGTEAVGGLELDRAQQKQASGPAERSGLSEMFLQSPERVRLTRAQVCRAELEKGQGKNWTIRYPS